MSRSGKCFLVRGCPPSSGGVATRTPARCVAPRDRIFRVFPGVCLGGVDGGRCVGAASSAATNAKSGERGLPSVVGMGWKKMTRSAFFLGGRVAGETPSDDSLYLRGGARAPR
jgi:hypothetical protein